MPEKQEVIELVPVDLALVKLTGTSKKMDATEDAWEFSAPPEPKVYKFRIFPARDGFKQGRYDPKDAEAVFYQTGVEAKIVSDDPDIDGFTCYCYFTTRIGKRRNISTMAGMIVKMGFKLPSEATDLHIAKMFGAALKKELIVEGELDWRGAYKDGPDWINQWGSYAEFPNKEGGGKKHIAVITDKKGNSHEIRAQAAVKRWFGKGEKPELVSQPRAQLVKLDETELLPPVAEVAKKPAVVATAGASSVDTDLELLLQAE